jgi:hypothetical protein
MHGRLIDLRRRGLETVYLPVEQATGDCYIRAPGDLVRRALVSI